MNNPDEEPDFETERQKIIGLGKASSRKSYYPELQAQVLKLRARNEELQTINEKLATTEEELHQNYEELLEKEQELFESKTRFQEVLDNSSVALYKRNFVTDSYDYISPAILSIIGYTPEEMKNLQKGELFHMIHPDDRERVRQIFDTLITMGGGHQILEYRFNHKDGQERWVKDIFQIFLDPSGNPMHTIGSFQDITDRKKIELSLKTAQKKLSLLNTTTFQDVLNSIFALSGYMQILHDANTDEKLSEYHDAASSLIHRVEESLKYAKYYQDLGIHPPKWHNVNLAFLNAISHLDLSHLSRTMELENLECFADPLLEFAFYTIMENIVIHSKTATKISISYVPAGENLLLIIEDNGIGIPDIRKERVFEKSFVRKKGLGLYFVCEILSITGMTIRETGIPGEGTRLEIGIPSGAFRFIDNN